MADGVFAVGTAVSAEDSVVSAAVEGLLATEVEVVLGATAAAADTDKLVSGRS
jgi:hypothetical protein